MTRAEIFNNLNSIWQGIASPTIRWIISVLGYVFLRSHLAILLILTGVIVAPIGWFAWEFFMLLSATSEQKAALADSLPFLSMLYFFSNSANFGEVWTILTPVLFAVSAGSSLESGLKPISLALFTIFFCAFIASEFCANFFSIDAAFKTQVTAAAQKADLDLSFEKFTAYATDVGKMCISAVAITLGISLVKS